MALTSIIQILKLNEVRSGKSQKTGKDYSMQDCECALLADTGVLEQVGVLQLPKEMMGEHAPQPGIYLGSFALRAGMQDRKIAAVLTGLQPYTVPKSAKAAVPS